MSPYNSAQIAGVKKISAGSPKKVNSIKIKNKLNQRKDKSGADENSSSSDETDELNDSGNNRKNQKSMKFKTNALQQNAQVEEEEKKEEPQVNSQIEENKEGSAVVEMESSGSKTSNFNSSNVRINQLDDYQSSVQSINQEAEEHKAKDDEEIKVQ